jgi:hypothetical protein
MRLTRRSVRLLTDNQRSGPGGSMRRLVTLAAAAGTGAMVVSSIPVVALAVSAPTKTTFTFTGALQGTFTQPNSDCLEVGSYGGMFLFDANKLKGSSDSQWTVNVNALSAKKKGGSYKTFSGITGNGASIVLEGTNGKQAFYWASKSGTLTTSPTGGSLSVNLLPDTSAFAGKPGKGNVHISGSYGCAVSTS